MITLRALKLKDFLSHKDTEISFKTNEKLSIEGKSGAGKSAIFDAILYALYGYTRGTSQSIVRRGSKACSVTLELNDGTSIFDVTRTTNLAGKNTLSVIEVDENSKPVHIAYSGIREIQNWIETKLIGASYDLFVNSVAYPQDNQNNFVKQTASRRKDLLLEIVGAGNFDEYYNTSRTCLSNEVVAKTSTENRINETDLHISDLSKKITDIPNREKQISDLRLTISSVKEDISNCKSKILSFSELDRNLNTQRSLVSGLTDLIHSRSQEIENYKLELRFLDSVDVEKLRISMSKYEPAKKELNILETKLRENAIIQSKKNNLLSNKPTVYDYSSDITRLRQQLLPLANNLGKCPAGDSCPFIIPIKNQITFLESQIKEKIEKEVRSQGEFKEWQDEFLKLPIPEEVVVGRVTELSDIVSEAAMAEHALAAYESTKEKTKVYKTNIDTLEALNNQDQTKILAITQAIDTLLKSFSPDQQLELNRLLSNQTTRLTILENELENSIRLLTMSQGYLSEIDNLKKTKEQLSSILDMTSKKIGALSAIKDAFGPYGIKAVIVDYIVPQLEEKINTVLSKMSDFRISLNTQKVKADGDGVTEGLFITIINDLGEELPYESYSGGEKLKITVAISEALASLQKCGFRILDEAVVGLDKDSTESFVSVLAKLQENFNQVLCISHIQEVKDMFTDNLNIIKDGGISKII